MAGLKECCDLFENECKILTPELLPTLGQHKQYNLSVTEPKFSGLWTVILPAYLYRWFIKVNCLPLLFIIFLRDFGCNLYRKNRKTKLDKRSIC